MWKIKVFILILFLHGILKCLAWRNFELVITNVSCSIYSKKVQKLFCVINKSPKNITMLTVNFMAAEDLYFDDLHTKANFLHNGQMLPIFDHKLNACEFLEGMSSGNALVLVFKRLQDPKVSNVPHKCPLKKNEEYFIKDFYLDTENFPPYMPHFIFNNSIDFVQSKELVMFFQLYGEMRAKTVAPKRKGRKEKRREKNLT